jgi:hypothetical protein
MTRYEAATVPAVKIKLLETVAMVFWYNTILALQLIPVERVIYILTQMIDNKILFSEPLARKRFVLVLGCFLLRHTDLPPEVSAMLPAIFGAALDMTKQVIQAVEDASDEEGDDAVLNGMADSSKLRDAYAAIFARLQRGGPIIDEDEDSFYNECEDLYDSPIDDIDETAYFQ